MSEKILITGASGFIGSTLVSEALDQGYKVYAGIRKTSSLNYLTDSRIQIVYIDFEDEDELVQSLLDHQFDYIIHNAGLTRAKKLSDFNKVNALYLENLLKSILKAQAIPKKMVFISSLAAYGPADHQITDKVDNHSLPMPVTIYGQSKLLAEEILSKYNGIIPYLIFRPTAVYGPKDVDVFSLIDMINKGFEIYVAKGRAVLTFIYVKDLTRLIMDALPSTHSGKAYFVGDGNNYATKELIQTIKKILGVKTLKIHIPLSLIWILSWILEKTSRLIGKYPFLNRQKYNEIKCQSWAIDCAPIKEDFNFVPQYKLSEGLKETISWYKTQNWL